ncbi:hypothetical protein BDZ91DRAFT_718158 [Kalaharituber pfeilii]|nr:hypothetical protein BDZ91DRAFT_718158 [Kalaharituber pfeilii]
MVNVTSHTHLIITASASSPRPNPSNPYKWPAGEHILGQDLPQPLETAEYRLNHLMLRIPTPLNPSPSIKMHLAFALSSPWTLAGLDNILPQPHAHSRDALQSTYVPHLCDPRYSEGTIRALSLLPRTRSGKG